MEALEKVSNEARTSIRNQSENGANMTTDVDGMLEKPRIGDVSAEDTQEMSEDQEDSNKSPVNAPISKSKA